MLFLEDILKYILERQLNSKHFCDNFLKQSKVKLLTQFCLGVSCLRWAQIQTSRYVFFAVAGKVKYGCVCNASITSNVSIPMLQMKVCFLWTPWKKIYGSILSQNYSGISRIYLLGDTNVNFSVNIIILNAAIIKYLTETVIFEDGF